MKILVADDHPLIREALQHVLTELDSAVMLLEAANGESVRRLVAGHADLDLLLLDLRLPGVSGFELLDELRRDYPPLPIVVLSALDDAGTVKAVLARGAMGFIPKSSPHQVMLSALRLVISGGRYLPPELLTGDAMEASSYDSVAATEAPVSAAGLGLTPRQQEVLGLMAQGKSNKQICRDLGLAEATVKIHVTAILKALKVTSRAQAIVSVNRLGLRFDRTGSASVQPAKP